MNSDDKQRADELSRFDGRNFLRECATIVGDKNYQSFKPHLEKLIRLSRSPLWQESVKSLALQWAILDTLDEVEAAISKGRVEVSATGDKAIELQRRRNIYLSKAYRQVGDGIAWRTLHFSRFRIRILSQGRHAGHVWGKAGRKAELNRAIAYVSNGGNVLLNDATTCLRVGDLVGMSEEADVSIAEIKKRKRTPLTAYSIARKLERNYKLSKQEVRLIQAQQAIDLRYFPDHDRQVPIEGLHHGATDFIRRAGQIMHKATRKGIYGELVSPYMYIEAIDLRTFSAMNDFGERLDRLSRKRPNLESLVDHSSYDRIVIEFNDEAIRSTPPYTVFPFSPKQIVKLILGEMYLSATIFISPLKEEFRRLGWELIIHNKKIEEHEPVSEAENIAYFSGYRLFPREKSRSNELMTLQHPNGFRIDIFDYIARMPQEFLSVEYIVSLAHAIMDKVKPGTNASIYPESLSDRARWT